MCEKQRSIIHKKKANIQSLQPNNSSVGVQITYNEGFVYKVFCEIFREELRGRRNM